MRCCILETFILKGRSSSVLLLSWKPSLKLVAFKLKIVLQVNCTKMSESHFDEYEHYNFEYDKHIFSGHSGKQRTKKEAEVHTNHFDPSGHSRKIATKLMNSEQNKKMENGKKS